MSKMLSVSDVAERLNVCPNTIREYLKKRMLPGIKLHRIWRVEEEDLQKFLKERKQGER